MNKQRLLKLASLLEADAANRKGIKFDLLVWGRVSKRGPRISCRTQACAIGLACLSPELRRQGLRYRTNEHKILEPIFRDKSDWEAVQAFFQIAHIEAWYLFNYNSYMSEERQGARGELAVAERIRNFVTSH